MKKFIYILVLIVLASCSEYQKVLKLEETAPKFKLGEALYKEGKFEKANRLFVQIVPNYRGKPQAEKLMYLYAMSFYKMKEYHVSSYQFERFVASYPRSEKIEEVSFLSVKSYYMLSPIYTKDQKETKEAIDKIQGFVNLFPDSKYLPEANKLVKELEFKLEKKAYSIAKQYNHISDYSASIKSFNNFIFEFPGSSLSEDVHFYRLDSAYKLGLNSIEFKKVAGAGKIIHLRKSRLETAKEYCDLFKKKYANSKYIEEVNNVSITIGEELKKYSIKS